MKLLSKYARAWSWELLLLVLLALTIVLGESLSPFFLAPFNLSQIASIIHVG